MIILHKFAATYLSELCLGEPLDQDIPSRCGEMGTLVLEVR